MPASAVRIAQLEAELQALRASLQDYSHAVGHDLRASARHVISYLQLVQDEAGAELAPSARGFLQNAQTSAEQLARMMDGLAGLAELARVAATPAPLALATLVSEVVADVRRQYAGRAIDWRIAPTLPRVWADAGLLRRALWQVLDNAAKFTAYQPAASISLQLQADTPGRARVGLVVADNGVGFDPALGARLCQPFQRLHAARQFAGLGLGLAVARQCLQRMGATLEMQAHHQQGCRVTLWLVAAEDNVP